MSFSTHFRWSIGLVALISISLLLAFLWIQRRIAGVVNRTVSPATILRKQDKEAVSYNSRTHELTIITSSSTVKEYTRDPVIHIQKDGKIKIDKKLFGLECSPFIGVGYSDRFQTYLGLNLVDFWRLDGGIALAYSPGSTRPLLSVGYNVYGNMNLGLGVDTSKQPHLMVAVRFW